jgi:hypothetical protein
MSREKSLVDLEMDLRVQGNLRRRTENEDESDYWRKRAGWYDDDVSMKSYNNGVYDTYYGEDDDGAAASSQSSSTSATISTTSPIDDKGLATFLKIGAVLLSVGISILLYRALMRRAFAKEKPVKKGGSASADDKRPRSRSKSASRSRTSRSRSRSRRETSSAGGYDLMADDKVDIKKSRDKVDSRRGKSPSRSRSRNRAASKSRSRSKQRHVQESYRESILV